MYGLSEGESSCSWEVVRAYSWVVLLSLFLSVGYFVNNSYLLLIAELWLAARLFGHSWIVLLSLFWSVG